MSDNGKFKAPKAADVPEGFNYHDTAKTRRMVDKAYNAWLKRKGEKPQRGLGFKHRQQAEIAEARGKK